MSDHTHEFDTALGACALRHGGAGVTAVLMPGTDTRTPSSEQSPAESKPPVEIARAAEAIERLLDGEPVDLRFIALDTARLSDFACDVYAAAREIPAGSTTSYGELARAAGHPGAAREVGAALARNPFPIVVPCHRVLAADGTLHGFSAPGGLATKRRMLEIERAPGFEQQPLFA